eukprot:TRINITY_DN1853_c1_g1_i3.p1 TRINITY_DN1853_c1_g1~~TRINITY_DN1853_c1_g1_i3.p1  ORF type:complete len:319 (+),score=45.95 TRINITY_DN1853_c1_g1_i3:112-1068(+)
MLDGGTVSGLREVALPSHSRTRAHRLVARVNEGLRSSVHFAAVQSVPVVVKLILYPVDRVRVAWQTNRSGQGGIRLNNLRSSPQDLLNQNGLIGVWRGFGTTLFRWYTYQNLCFCLKDTVAGVCPKYTRDTPLLYFASKVGAGSAAGVAASLLWGYPLDVLKQRLATSRPDSGGLAHTARQVYRDHSVAGFYRGFAVDIPGVVVFRGVQLGGWDAVRDAYGAEWESAGAAHRTLIAQAVTVAASAAGYPYDTVRRNLMRSAEAGASYREVLRQGVASMGGYRRFLYAGFMVRQLGSCVNGALLSAYDEYRMQASLHAA